MKTYKNLFNDFLSQEEKQMWRKAESKIKPMLIDTTSSNTVVYVRKNIEEVTRDEETLFVYDEQEVKKEDWELYQSILANTSDIADVQDALIELASIIVEG